MTTDLLSRVTDITQADILFAADLCELTGWHGVAAILRNEWQPYEWRAETVETKIVTLAAKHRAEALKELQGEIERLREGLAPFAKAGELFPEPVEYDQCIYCPAAGSEYALCGEDLRRARETYEGQPLCQ